MSVSSSVRSVSSGVKSGDVGNKVGRLVFVRTPANALQAEQIGESEIRIGECIVRIDSFRGQKVRVVVEAPVEIPVWRGEMRVTRDVPAA